MTRFSQTFLPALILGLGLAQTPAAQADVTADQVWALMKDSIQGPDFSLTGVDRRQGSNILLSQLKITFVDGTVLQLPDITLQEMLDRSVKVILPPRFPLSIGQTPRPNKPDQFTVSVAAPDLDIVLRGLGESTEFQITAPSVSAALDPVLFPPGTGQKDEVFAALAAADISISFAIDNAAASIGTTGMAVTGAASLGTLHAELRVDIRDEPSKGEISLDLSALNATLQGFKPAEFEASMAQLDRDGDPGAAPLLHLLDQGLRFDGHLTYGPLTFIADIDEGVEGPVKIDLASDSGMASAIFDRAQMGYDTGIGPTRLFFKISDPAEPIELVELAFTEYRQAMWLDFPQPKADDPTQLSAAPTDWGLVYKLTGLTLSAQVWDLFDKAGTLPRDPMSFIVDLAGTYTLDPKVLSPAWRPLPNDPPPLLTATLNLTELLAQGLGLSFTGTGGMSFDFSDMVTFDGSPLPSGKMSFVTSGANGLIDQLSQLGLLSAEDITAARFGMMFLGRIEGGADRLVSSIEFRDGVFYLNGQKIR
ncbi:MAG: hypothetical protein WAT09_01835 [Paracoccaceae bacterium]